MAMIGTTIGGRYRLDAIVGRGGMSTVYRAFDTVLERPVAIKMMHREIATDSDQLERFRREARSVAQLNHPHVVTVIDAGEEPSEDPVHEGGAAVATEVGTPYIVLEFVDGVTLKQLIREGGPLEIPQAIAYAIEIARALGAAHERQIVHRDVKPHNVLISEEGGAKITDFGIARTLTEEGLTMAGRVLGTTDYVSPEQALGQPVTGQSDLYSLGVVLFEMITGDVPFHGDSPVAVAMKHVREQVPDVLTLRPELSAATATVIDRALSKDLEHRYEDAAGMVAELEEALALEATRTGQTTGEVTTVLRSLPGKTKWRLPWTMLHAKRWAVATATVVLGVAIALGVAAYLHTHRGTGSSATTPPTGGLEQVSLSASAAHSYNPFGTGPENRDLLSDVVDNDPNTVWSTEQYYSGTLQKTGGVGLGIYLDAAPGVAARALEVQTPTPGFAAQVYVASTFVELPYGNSRKLAERGWHGPVASVSYMHSTQRIPLDLAGESYRYYLLWLTTLPPKQESAGIAGIALFK
jgi:serine/threonine-protein kinase